MPTRTAIVIDLNDPDAFEDVYDHDLPREENDFEFEETQCPHDRGFVAACGIVQCLSCGKVVA